MLLDPVEPLELVEPAEPLELLEPVEPPVPPVVGLELEHAVSEIIEKQRMTVRMEPPGKGRV